MYYNSNFKQEQRADGLSLTKMDCSLWSRQVTTMAGTKKRGYCKERHIGKPITCAGTRPLLYLSLQLTLRDLDDERAGISCDVCLIKILGLSYLSTNNVPVC